MNAAPLRARGFTLVEVVVAVAMLAVAVLAVLRTADQMVRTVEGVRSRTFAHWAAMNRAEELRMFGSAALGNGAGPETIGGIEWAVSEESSPAPLGLVRVEIHATAADQPGAMFVTWLPRQEKESR